MEAVGLAARNLSSDPDITGLTEDSRKVEPGFLFAAVCGSRSDGADYLKEAVQRGAAAILVEPGISLGLQVGVPIISVQQTRQHYSLLAAQFYRTHPSTIAVVTGTNGKKPDARRSPGRFDRTATKRFLCLPENLPTHQQLNS